MRQTRPTNIKKRSFLSILLKSTLFIYIASIFHVIISSLIIPKGKKAKKSKPLNLGKIEDIQKNPNFNKKNKSMTFSFNGIPSILIQINENQYKAFNALCTHLGCVVGFKKTNKTFYCNCHGGVYNLEGKNIAGPPPKPLVKYKVLSKDGNVIIKEE